MEILHPTNTNVLTLMEILHTKIVLFCYWWSFYINFTYNNCYFYFLSVIVLLLSYRCWCGRQTLTSLISPRFSSRTRTDRKRHLHQNPLSLISRPGSRVNRPSQSLPGGSVYLELVGYSLFHVSSHCTVKKKSCMCCLTVYKTSIHSHCSYTFVILKKNTYILDLIIIKMSYLLWFVNKE